MFQLHASVILTTCRLTSVIDRNYYVQMIINQIFISKKCVLRVVIFKIYINQIFVLVFSKLRQFQQLLNYSIPYLLSNVRSEPKISLDSKLLLLENFLAFQTNSNSGSHYFSNTYLSLIKEGFGQKTT